MRNERLLMLPEGVQVEVRGDLTVWSSRRCRVVCKVKSAGLLGAVEALRKGPVQSSLFPTGAVEELVRRGLLLEGEHEDHLRALRQHYRASPPFNQGQPYTKEELTYMQDRARQRRFSERDQSGRALEVPLPLRRWPSLSTETDESGLLPVEKEVMERLLFTLFDSQNRLHPSAGALYPIRIYVEQHEGGEARRLSFEASAGSVVCKSLAPDCHGVSLDPMLTMAGTRVWLCADLGDITRKYGERGYRYALLEAGHVAQVILQLLNEQGLSTRPFGGFDDLRAAHYLELPAGEVAVYALGVYRTESFQKAGRWLVAEDMRYALINKLPVQYAVAYGGRDGKGKPIYGYGIGSRPELARLKSQAELAERKALVACREPIGNSNGMAAHVDFAKAAQNAMLELYERHCVLRVWHCEEVTDEVRIPDSEAGRIALALARLSQTKIVVKDCTDSLYQVPCLLAVLHAEGHGGVLTASSAAATEEEAMNKVLWELIKALFYRMIIRNVPVFAELDEGDCATVTDPEDHEAWYSRPSIRMEETSFLVEHRAVRVLSAERRSLKPLGEVTEIQDFTAYGPDPNRWKIARAVSDRLLRLDFGKPSDAYWERLERIAGPVKNRRLHPIG